MLYRSKKVATLSLAALMALSPCASFASETHPAFESELLQVQLSSAKNKWTTTSFSFDDNGVSKEVEVRQNDERKIVSTYDQQGNLEGRIIVDFVKNQIFSSYTGKTESLDSFPSFSQPTFSTRSDVSYYTARVSFADVKRISGESAGVGGVISAAVALIPGANVVGSLGGGISAILQVVNWVVPDDPNHGFLFTVKQTKYYRNHLGKRYVYRTDKEITDVSKF